MADKDNKNTMDPRIADQGGADRINNISYWLKRHFGRKMIKLSIDGGFTCPNRDGAKGVGGCLFCGEGAGGDFASDIDSQIKLYQAKWPDAGYIAYFQNHTNTYTPILPIRDTPGLPVQTRSESAYPHDLPVQTRSESTDPDDLPVQIWSESAGSADAVDTQSDTITGSLPADVDVLRTKYMAALDDPRISGIAIATRPDCLPPDVLDLLAEINEHHFMWVELGLQSSSDDTAMLINRCYPTEVYDQAMQALNSRGIKTVTHLILGLPGESEHDMRCSVEHAIKMNTWGIKLHMLNVVRGSRLAVEMPDYVPFQSMDEYINLVCDLLEIIPPEITIHRLTADAPRSTLIAPEWSYMKRSILNGIHAELRRRNTYQGIHT
ncbi:MAG: TIGR01212 family radical SAM protein [Eubacterium sp.]|nr:TIGR01212 family radical SAM protein [Eubacterium sp.]